MFNLGHKVELRYLLSAAAACYYYYIINNRNTNDNNILYNKSFLYQLWLLSRPPDGATSLQTALCFYCRYEKDSFFSSSPARHARVLQPLVTSSRCSLVTRALGVPEQGSVGGPAGPFWPAQVVLDVDASLWSPPPSFDVLLWCPEALVHILGLSCVRRL